MAVAHDVTTKAHSGNNVSASEASFTWSHVGASSGVNGLLVSVWTNAAASIVTSVTYGGVTVPAVSGGEAVDGTGEPGVVTTFFLTGPTLLQGTNNVVVNRTNNATSMTAVSTTFTAATGFNTAIHGIDLTTGDSTVAEIAINDGSPTPGGNSLRYAAAHFGHQTPPTTGASSTGRTTTDPGATCFQTVRETTAGQGSRSVGFSSGTSDDRAIVTFAVKEIPAPDMPIGAATLTGLAASVLVPVLLAMPLGAVAVTGLSIGPAFSGPNHGTVAITGHAPTVSAASGTTIVVPDGAFVVAGTDAGVGFDGPVPGAIALTGYAPTALAVLEIAVPAGAGTCTGLAPSLAHDLPVPAGAVTATGTATPLAFVSDVAVGDVTFTGLAPSLSGATVIDTPAGALAATGTVSSLAFTASVPAGAIALTELAPVAAATMSVAVPAGALSAQGLTPALAFRADVPIGGVALTGHAPSIAGLQSIAVPVGTATLTGLSVGAAFEGPERGVLTLNGHAPFVFTAGEIPTGAVTLTGTAPVLAYAQAVPTGAVTLTGAAPVVSVSRLLEVPAGAIALDGKFVAVVFHTPTAGAVTFIGYAPTVIAESGTTIAPPAGVVTLTGTAPVLAYAKAIPAGSIAVSGTTVTLTPTLPIPAGAVTLTGTAPTVVFGPSHQIGVPAAAIAFVPQYVAISFEATSDAPGVVTFTGYAPTVSVQAGGQTLAVPAGSVVATGTATVLSSVLPVPAGAIALTGRVPALSTESSQAIPTGTVTLAGSTTTLALACAIQTGALAVTGYAPSSSPNVSVLPGAGTVTLTGTTAVVARGVDLPVGSLACTGLAPSLAFACAVPVGSIACTGQAPVVACAIVVSLGAVTVTGLAPAVGTSYLLAVPVGEVTLGGDAILPFVGGLIIEAYPLVLTGHAPLALHMVPDVIQATATYSPTVTATATYESAVTATATV